MNRSLRRLILLTRSFIEKKSLEYSRDERRRGKNEDIEEKKQNNRGGGREKRVPQSSTAAGTEVENFTRLNGRGLRLSERRNRKRQQEIRR